MQNKVKITGAGFEIWKRSLCAEAEGSGRKTEREGEGRQEGKRERKGNGREEKGEGEGEEKRRQRREDKREEHRNRKTENIQERDDYREKRRNLGTDALSLKERPGLLATSQTKGLLRRTLHELQRWWQPSSGTGRVSTDTQKSNKDEQQKCIWDIKHQAH